MVHQLLDGFLVKVKAVGSPIDQLVWPAEADKIRRDDPRIQFAFGEVWNHFMVRLRPEWLAVKAEQNFVRIGRTLVQVVDSKMFPVVTCVKVIVMERLADTCKEKKLRSN